MSAYTGSIVGGQDSMSEYEAQVWEAVNAHWQRRNNRRGLPNWASAALDRTGEVARSAGSRVSGVVPETVKQPVRRATDAVAAAAIRPTIESATALLELVNAWAQELNDPEGVEKLARKHGLELGSFAELRQQDLKVCDRLLARNTLKWRTLGALEGGAMGVLALIPVGGLFLSMTADVLVIQVLSRSIASRIAYSYGYDAKDPAERAFIDRLVTRSFMEQAAKAKPLSEAARAASAIKGRVRWSEKLRTDHRLIAALEKLMQHLGPAGATVPVTNVAKVVPFVGILVGAGTNATVLGRVATDAQRFCQTRLLCEKYGLPLPVALAKDQNDSA